MSGDEDRRIEPKAGRFSRLNRVAVVVGFSKDPSKDLVSVEASIRPTRRHERSVSCPISAIPSRARA